jgi:hypothetical protein
MFAIVDTRAHYKTTIVTRPHDEELRQGQSPDPLDLLYYLTTTAGAITRLDVTANQPAPDWALRQTKWTRWKLGGRRSMSRRQGTTADTKTHTVPRVRVAGGSRSGRSKSRPLLLSGDLSSEHEERWKALRHRALEDAGTFSPFRTRNAA